MKIDKKWIGVMILVQVVLSAVVGTATAYMEVTTSMQVIGEGTYDAEILIQSANNYSGLKYFGESYTPALGRYGPSTLALSAEYMLMWNNHSELMIAEESEITNVRSKRCFKNYELGTLQAFNTFGNYTVLAEFGGDVNMSMMMVEAEVSGKAFTEVTVRDLGKSHFYIVRDRAEYKGYYRFGISSQVKRVEEPRADFDDWLACP